MSNTMYLGDFAATEMESKIAKYLDHIRAEYLSWTTNHGQKEIDEIKRQMIHEFNESLFAEVGKKFIKIVTRRTGNTSVHSFIVLKAEDKFIEGDILKAASWAAPAKNYARGNIFSGNFMNIHWTGAV